MRKSALTLLACALAALPQAGWTQSEPPATADDYVCAFTGECAAEEALPVDENGDRPRLSATRGFALSGSSRPRATPPRPARPARRPAHAQAQAQAQPAPRRPAGPGQRVNLRLSFDTGSASLNPSARAQADTFAQALLRPQLLNLRFQIEGHTDSVGSRTSNVELSRRRAQAVADYLIGMGVRPDRLMVRGYGPDRPLPGTRATAGENRRVEAVRIS